MHPRTDPLPISPFARPPHRRTEPAPRLRRGLLVVVVGILLLALATMTARQRAVDAAARTTGALPVARPVIGEAPGQR